MKKTSKIVSTCLLVAVSLTIPYLVQKTEAQTVKIKKDYVRQVSPQLKTSPQLRTSPQLQPSPQLKTSPQLQQLKRPDFVLHAEPFGAHLSTFYCYPGAQYHVPVAIVNYGSNYEALYGEAVTIEVRANVEGLGGKDFSYDASCQEASVGRKTVLLSPETIELPDPSGFYHKWVDVPVNLPSNCLSYEASDPDTHVRVNLKMKLLTGPNITEDNTANNTSSWFEYVVCPWKLKNN